jgi:hypothetical protein
MHMSKAGTINKNNQKDTKVRVVVPPEAVRPEEPPAEDSKLRRLAVRIITLNQKSSRHAYELGACFADVKLLVPEKRFGQWVKEFSGYTVRSAWNYISIHNVLRPYEDQLVEHAVKPTVMFELAKGEPAQIEAVVARIAAGERILTKDVKAAFGVEPKQKGENSLSTKAGVAGLRKVAQAKVQQDEVVFMELMKTVLAETEKALEPLAAGRAVVKNRLQEAVALHCRHAHDLFNSIAAPLEPGNRDLENWRPADLPEGTAWRGIQKLLQQMGGIEQWPGKADFVPWLQNEVVPKLRFVVHGEALPGMEGDHAASEQEADDADGFLPYEKMPKRIQDIVDNSLLSSPPEKRASLRSKILFDPKPFSPQAA